MVKCGNCKESHESVAAVKACYVTDGGIPTIETVGVAVTEVTATERQLAYFKNLVEMRDTTNLAIHDLLVLGDTKRDVLADKPVSRTLVSHLIDLLKLLPPTKPKEVRWPTVVAGKYALYGDDGAVGFYRVDRPTEGKWNGYTFVKRLVGSPGDWAEYSCQPWRPIMDEIEKMGARESAALFGLKTVSCGQCGSPLSQLRSRAAGYGEKCADKLGWPYPTEAQARAILEERGETE